MGDVRLATPADADALSRVLAKAFASDAVASYLFPDPARRARRLVPFFLAQLRHVYLPRGQVYTTDDLVGVAMWIGPDAPPIRLRDGLAQLGMLTLLGRRFFVTRRLARFLAAYHPREAHYYLGTLGTDPDHRRQGVATSLLAPALARCDEQNIPAYLECSTIEARTLYERHGFVTRAQVSAPGGGPQLWLMTRQPHAQGEGLNSPSP